jgi:pyruvate/2-oxoglutarate dehydrogenase complex dihydrolipoamide acyltransferase (E2) component
MTHAELIDGLRNRFVADRPTIQEAYDYALAVAKSTDGAPHVMVAVQVVVNTICNELEKIENEKKELAEEARQLDALDAMDRMFPSVKDFPSIRKN